MGGDNIPYFGAFSLRRSDSFSEVPRRPWLAAPMLRADERPSFSGSLGGRPSRAGASFGGSRATILASSVFLIGDFVVRCFLIEALRGLRVYWFGSYSFNGD